MTQHENNGSRSVGAGHFAEGGVIRPCVDLRSASTLRELPFFTGKEIWLTIPVDMLTWNDLPVPPGDALMVLCLRQMPYREYLRTEHWSAVRQRALTRYNRQCMCCQDAVDVHHVNYDHKGFEWQQDVIALCRECHTRWHQTWQLQARASLASTP